MENILLPCVGLKLGRGNGEDSAVAMRLRQRRGRPIALLSPACPLINSGGSRNTLCFIVEKTKCQGVLRHFHRRP
jgi:hypothetical protein